MADELIELANADGVVTITLEGETPSVQLGGRDLVATIVLSSPVDADAARVSVDADGQVLAGGGRASGRFVGYHEEGRHGDPEHATVVLDAERGVLELGRFDPSGRRVTIQLHASEGTARIGGPETAGTVVVTDERDRVGIQLRGRDGVVRAGGRVDGALQVASRAGRRRAELDAEDASLRLRLPPTGPQGPGFTGGDEPLGPVTVEISGDRAEVVAGGGGEDGTVRLRRGDGAASLQLDGANAEVRAGGEGTFGVVTLRNREGATRIALNGQAGRVSAESGRFRAVTAIDDGGAARVQLSGPEGAVEAGFGDVPGRVEVRSGTSGQASSIVLSGRNGAEATADVGGGDRPGRVSVRDGDGRETVAANGATGNLALGRQGNAGGFFVKDGDGENIAVVNGATGNLALGRQGNAGGFFVKDATDQDVAVLNGDTATLALGRNGKPGNLFVKRENGDNAIHLSGRTGDILLFGGDCAEEFDVAEDLDAGTVVVADADGALRQAARAYDRRVAGVVSGAGDRRPGIVLGRDPANPGRVPIALIGTVNCKVDATSGPISVGDLLVTSATPGHAMRATDRDKAFGAVIGKALRPWPAGLGTITVLVALQ